VVAIAERRAAQLTEFMDGLSVGSDAASADQCELVEDATVPPEIRAVFIEESDEIIQELIRLTEEWAADPQVNEVLRDIRRHFHTFKGNGRAVGANVLGELGWAAQDMLDHVLDGDLEPSEAIRELVAEVVRALPVLISSYQGEEGLDVAQTRDLTDRCFRMVKVGDDGPAANMPHAAEVSRSQIRLVASSPAPGQVTH
jgi:chemotaxis protein histidine kinase CheA